MMMLLTFVMQDVCDVIFYDAYMMSNMCMMQELYDGNY